MSVIKLYDIDHRHAKYCLASRLQGNSAARLVVLRFLCAKTEVPALRHVLGITALGESSKKTSVFWHVAPYSVVELTDVQRSVLSP
jgi:hypothetical protein